MDNATIHQAQGTLIAFLEEIFGGYYCYSARYSPRLKHIEPCFALVKEWIRNHEDEATLDPVGTINQAFEMFKLGVKERTRLEAAGMDILRTTLPFTRI